MTITRTALICLIATAGLSACSTMDTAVDVELDNLSDAIDEAVLAGDYQLAADLGYEFLGLPVEGNGSDGDPLPAASGFIAGIILPGTEIEPNPMLRGRMIDPETGDRHQISGTMAAPLEGQNRGIVTAGTTNPGELERGHIYGDYRTVNGDAEQGSLRATWNIVGEPVTAYVNAIWRMDADGAGRVFGNWTELEVPSWTDGVRVRIEVAGLTMVSISDDKVWVTPLAEEEDVEVDGAHVNGASYELVYTELSCPDNPDMGCTTEPYNSPDGAIIDLTTGAELTTLIGRGGMALAEEPSEDNGWVASIIIDDEAYSGASVYEFELNPTN